MYSSHAFVRENEEEDRRFYACERPLPHLDVRAREHVQEIIRGLVTEPEPVILDLMASWDSHLPLELTPRECVGLGMNGKELEKNPVLTERVIHDLNRDPYLPFPNARFDVVLNTVSVDYLTRPFEVFRDVARVLKPGGLFLVTFSNRMFPTKAVRRWKEASEAERIWIVEDYFQDSGAFGDVSHLAVIGRPRPADDAYAELGVPSDPVYAVWAERVGEAATRVPRSRPDLSVPPRFSETEILRRKQALASTLRCPHCDERLSRWEVPQHHFSVWAESTLRICFNDHCPYLMAGWDTLSNQGNIGLSYRFCYVPDRDVCTSIPVPSLRALRESILEERR